ncbi:shikimate kinase [Collinsella stercoris]|uniref:shikimate kinase n=1 Tax=Collinsella stercoris TaxID=147206 RepID=UPI0023F226C1|nr:shikimate kinase [Collinsella stercoris]
MTSAVKHGCDHVFFVGFLGAGKSTLARNLGRMFHRRFVDTDRLVERRCGSTVTKLFEEFGEERFRELETAALEGLRGERSLLVSCGGGIVETPRNIELMHDMGFCVYLDGDLDDSLRQIRRSDTRPDFRSAEHAARLLEHRRPLYEQAAALTVASRGTSFTDVSYTVAELLLERGLI